MARDAAPVSKDPRQHKIPVKIRSHFAGGHRSRVTPVPIPNTEVKPTTADGTAWETVWESKSLPALLPRSPIMKMVGLFVVRQPRQRRHIAPLVSRAARGSLPHRLAIARRGVELLCFWNPGSVHQGSIKMGHLIGRVADDVPAFDPMNGSAQTPVRRDWLTASVREVQLAANISLVGCDSLEDYLAELVHRIPTPSTVLEHVVAFDLLRRTAWHATATLVRRQDLAAHEALDQFHRIVTVTESVEWRHFAEKLRSGCRQSSTPSLPERMKRILDARWSGVTLADLGRSAGCSVRKATAAFRDQYGMTIHEYVTRRRITHAVTLLLTSDMKLAAVAEAVGLRDKSSLHRHFTRVTGVTPRSLRRAPQQAEAILERVRLPSGGTAGLPK